MDVKGLLVSQFAGADLSGATTPDAIKNLEDLEVVTETSKNARKIFLSMLLACAYVLLTVATTTDAALLQNVASSTLPIIQTKIPIAWFYFAAPLIIFSLYFYLHLYLQRLWEVLASLPAVWVDGKPIHQKIYPWLLNGLVRADFARLEEERSGFSKVEVGVSIFLAWWTVPITLLVSWGRYLPRHDWWGTGFNIALITLSIAFGLVSHWLARRTLRGIFVRRFRWSSARSDQRMYRIGAGLASGVLVLAASVGAINGIRADRLDLSDARTWVPRAFNLIAYAPFADFEERDVSTKPENWTGKKKEEVDLVKGAALRGRDLRYANAFRAFLVKADLREANLQGAFLLEANLQEANLFEANLREARLVDANLRGADLTYADLRQAILYRTKLQGAELGGAIGLTQDQIDRACIDDETCRVISRTPSGAQRNRRPNDDMGDMRRHFVMMPLTPQCSAAHYQCPHNSAT